MADYWSTSDVDLHLEVDPATGRRAGLEQALRDGDPRTAGSPPGPGCPRPGRWRSELGPGARDGVARRMTNSSPKGTGRGARFRDRVADLGSQGVHDEPATAAGSVGTPGPASERPRDQPLRLQPAARHAGCVALPAGRLAPRRAPGAERRSERRLRLRRSARPDRAAHGTRRVPRAGPRRARRPGADRHHLRRRAGTWRCSGRCSAAARGDGGSVHTAVPRGRARAPAPRSCRCRWTTTARASTCCPGAGTRGVGTVVVTPSHQYPIGSTLHPARRQALVEWARAGRRLIVEDDYDGEFRYDRQPVGALQGMAPDHTVYLGTASKTLGPGRAAGLDGAARAPGRAGHRGQAARRPPDRGARPADAGGVHRLARLRPAHPRRRLRYRRRRDLLAERLQSRPDARRPASRSAASPPGCTRWSGWSRPG